MGLAQLQEGIQPSMLHDTILQLARLAEQPASRAFQQDVKLVPVDTDGRERGVA